MDIDKRSHKRLNTPINNEEGELYRSLIELSPDPMVILQDGRYKLISTAFIKTFGYTKTDVKNGLQFMQLVQEKDKEEVWKQYEKRLHGERVPKHYRIDLIAKDGSLIPCETSATLIHFDGRPADLVIIRDISKRIQYEESLRESEEKYRTLVELSPDPVVILQDGFHKLFSSAITRTFGYTKTDIKKGLAFMQHVLDKDKKTVRKRYEDRLKGKKVSKNFRIDIIAKNGTIIPCETSASLMQYKGKPADLVIIRDISERLQFENALRESEELFRSLTEKSPNMIFINQEGRIVFANEKCIKILGYSHHDLYAESFNFLTLIAPESVDLIKKKYRLHQTQKEVEPYEYTLIAKDGRKIEAINSTRLITYKGKPAILGVVTDITARKQIETALQTSEERFRRIFEDGPLGMMLSRPDNTLVSINTRACEMLDYSEKEIKELGKNSFIHPDDFDLENKGKIKALITGKLPFLKKEVRYIRKDGDIIWADTTACLIRDQQGKPIYLLAMLEDITTQRKMEEELRKIQKLESISVLAGGIAHDFNNIMTGIIGGVSLAMTEVDQDSAVMQTLQDTQNAAFRARDLTQRLLTFSKGGAPILKTTSIKTLLKDSAIFAIHGSNVTCTYDLSDDLKPVKIDEGQISQVINNLAINSVQAMPEGGTITIAAENVTLSENDIVSLDPGKYIKVSVADQGNGIPETHLAKIFDPFYSTKTRGSGLGLATSFSIIKRHNGYITAESEVDKGATFTFYLPASNSDKERGKPKNRNIQKGSGTILIVDDDAFVRLAVTKILVKLGYTIDQAANGEEAVEKFTAAQKSDTPFDLVITDLTIPGGMGGVETTAELKKIDPAVKVIVSSGYSTDPILAHYEEYGFAGRIAKPYTIEEISKTIHAVMATT